MNPKSNSAVNLLAQTSNKKGFSWLTCGIIVLVLLCGGGLIATLSFGGILAIFGGDPQGLQVDNQLPTDVKVGETFNLDVSLTNNGSQSMTVDEIQISKE